MAQLSESDFYNKWIAEFRTRGDAGITGAMMGLFMADIKDSCTFKSNGGSGGGSDQLDYGFITSNDIDENNIVTIQHGLGTTCPIIVIFDANGIMLNGMNFTPQVLDSNSVQIEFEDPPTAVNTYGYLIWKKLNEITHNAENLGYLYVAFGGGGDTAEGEGYYIHPPDFISYTKLGNGTVEDHLGPQTNFNFEADYYGIMIVNENTGTRYLLVLEHDFLNVEAGETYRVECSLLGSGNFTLNVSGVDVEITSGNVSVDVLMTESGKFYIQFDSDDDIHMIMGYLSVTKL